MFYSNKRYIFLKELWQGSYIITYAVEILQITFFEDITKKYHNDGYYFLASHAIKM